MKKAKLVVTMMLGAALLVPAVSMAKPTTPYLTTPIQITEMKSNEGNFNIDYPQVTGMANAKAQETINNDIKHHVDTYVNAMKHVQAGGATKYNKDVVTDKLATTVDYNVMCNTYGMVSFVINETSSVPHKDGKVYTLDMKQGMTYTKEGGPVKAVDMTKIAKICNHVDPFSHENLKSCVDALAKTKGFVPVKNYAGALSQAKDNFYLDNDTNIHALFFPGTVAPESYGWLDVQIG